MFRPKGKRFKKSRLTMRKLSRKIVYPSTNSLIVSPRMQEAAYSLANMRLISPDNGSFPQSTTTDSPWKMSTPRQSEAAEVLCSLSVGSTRRNIFNDQNEATTTHSPRKTTPRQSEAAELLCLLSSSSPAKEVLVPHHSITTHSPWKVEATPRQSEAAQVLCSLACTPPVAKSGLFSENGPEGCELETTMCKPRKLISTPKKSDAASPRLIRLATPTKSSPKQMVFEAGSIVGSMQQLNSQDLGELDGVAPLPDEEFTTGFIENIIPEEHHNKEFEGAQLRLPVHPEEAQQLQLEVVQFSEAGTQTAPLIPHVRTIREVLTYEFILSRTPKEFRRLTGMYQPQFLILLEFLDERNARFEEPFDESKGEFFPEPSEKPSDGLVYRSDRPPPKVRRERILSSETRLLITLLRLRRGWDVEDLALFFGVGPTLVSRIVYTWIQFMYHQFKRIQSAMFVSRHEQPRRERPQVFKPFDNFRVCIDTTEVRIQTPENLQQQGDTYSDYKSGNVWLYLIGISCWGGMSFISPGFEGSMSDEAIYTKSGIRQFLEPGDVILADRGFTVEEECDEDCVTILHPPFLKGRKNFTPEEEMVTREVAKARIFVEHLVRKIKVFRILKKIYNTMLHYLDQLVYVAGCIVNFLPCVVKDKVLKDL